MGLIGWIKNKHFTSRLNKADKLRDAGQLDEAESLYREILGKQSFVSSHLAHLLAMKGKTASEKIEYLNQIVLLRPYVSDEDKNDYDKEFVGYIEKLKRLAQDFFSKKDYPSAVILADGINSSEYHVNLDFLNNMKRYHAYKEFYATQNINSYIARYKKVVGYLKSYPGWENDAKVFYASLTNAHKYQRAIDLLIQCDKSNYKKEIIQCSIYILQGKDAELKANIADSQVLNGFLSKIKSINLDNSQRQQISDSVYTLAVQADANKSIGICQRFLSEERFRSLYIAKAYELAKQNKFNSWNDLKKVIEHNTDSDTRVDIVAKFAVLTNRYDGYFKELAISKIKRVQDIHLFQTYWNIKDGIEYFNELIVNSFAQAYDVVNIILKERNTFLVSPAYNKAFAKAVCRLSSTDFVINILERLISYQYDIDDIYADKMLLIAKADSEESQALSIIDHALNFSSSEKLCNAWLSLYAKIKCQETETIASVNERIKFINSILDTIFHSKVDYKNSTDKQLSLLWEILVNTYLEKSKNQREDKAIEDLTLLREKVLKNGQKNTSSEIVSTITSNIVKIRWAIAKDKETDNEFKEAIAQYESIRKERESNYSIRAEFRSLICHLKSNDVNQDIELRIKESLKTNSYESLKEDLAYRYACFLLQNIRPSEAKSIIDTYFPNDNELKSICRGMFANKAQKDLNSINSVLNDISNGKTSEKQITELLAYIDSNQDSIVQWLPDAEEQIKACKQNLESSLLSAKYESDDYEGVISMLIKAHPDFISNDDIYRNIAIAALGAVEDNRLGETDIRLAISIWLSAIYTDRLFVRSLDYTQWDDPFSFTLKDSLGRTRPSDYKRIPDNVNFDEPLEGQIVSIKDVQNNLLTRFETAITKNFPQYETFFNEEKQAMEDLLDIDCNQPFILVAPYLSVKFPKVRKGIKKALESEYNILGPDYSEPILQTGVEYRFKTKPFSGYKDILDELNECKAALRTLSPSRVKGAFANVAEIRTFENLYGILKAYVSTEMNSAIKEKTSYKSFLDVYEIVCQAMRDNSLSLTCTGYVNEKVIKLVNDGKMALRVGTSYMARLYMLAPSDYQVKQNLEAMLENLVAEVEEKNNPTDKNALNNIEKVLRNDGHQDLINKVHIQGKLTAIVSKVNGKTMQPKQALVEVFEMYKKSPNDDRICANLVTLCDICINKYIAGDEYGRNEVERILNSINNMKSVTFRKHAVSLGKSFFDIISKLSIETLSTFADLNPSSSLNSKGYALKAALKYMKRLGSVSFEDIDGLDNIYKLILEQAFN